jgi:hypothetical protein
MRSKRDEEVRKLENRIRAIRKAIDGRLRALGVVFEWSDHLVPRLSIEGHDMNFGLRPQYNHAGAGSLSDRLTMRFGDSRFKRAVSLNEPATGYNLTWVVDLLLERYARESAWASEQAEAPKAVARHALAAARINRDLGLAEFVYEGSLVEKLEASGHEQGIQVTIDLVCDERKARSILGWVKKEIAS